MAIASFNLAIVGRSSGKSSVHAAAYASRMDLTDDRTGIVYRFGRKSGDVVASFIWLPLGAPDHLRDRATLWNAVEKAEKRKNSQLARRIILALPHELTPKQQQELLKDFVRENFTRKGLAADVNIHKPDPKGDQRNDHAHILIPTRFFDKKGIGKKDRDSNDRQMLQVWRDDWEKKVNRQLERYGHDARISMKSLEAQGIDRTPQIHLGQGATALDRKGKATDRAELLRSIANDNEQGRGIANDLGRAVGKEADPETIDRDKETADRQDAIDAAGIAFEQSRREGFLHEQAAERRTMEQHGQDMAARHATAWGEAIGHHSPQQSVHEPAMLEDTAEATASTFSFLFSWFTGLAETVTGTKKRSGKAAKAEKVKEQQERQRKEQQLRQHEALLAEQSHEREQFERRRSSMLRDQERARTYFDQQESERSGSSLQQAFEIQSVAVETYREALIDSAARKEAQQERGGFEPT